MKTKIAFLFLAYTAAFSTAIAQSREDDDMYFTSKDRAVMNAAMQKDRQEIFASSNARRITESEVSSTINPTDSYSARNVNPEYISGAKVGSTASTDAPYFSPNYQPTAVNQNLASNCNSCGFNSFNNNFNNGFYSPYSRFGNPYAMGGMGMMGMGMSPWGYNNMGMMNPYYDPWMMNGMNGFYQPGLSFSFGMGSGWGNGWNSFYSPWGYNSWGMNSFYGGWGNSWGMNSFYGNGWNTWGNPWMGRGTTVVYVDRPRPTSARNEEIDRYYNSGGNRGGGNSGGRVVTSDNSQQYYNRGWRNDTAIPARGTDTWNNTRSYQQNYNGWNDNSRSNWGGSSFNNGFGGGRSSGFSGGGGGGGVSSGGGGGGGGARRGRD